MSPFPMLLDLTAGRLNRRATRLRAGAAAPLAVLLMVLASSVVRAQPTPPASAPVPRQAPRPAFLVEAPLLDVAANLRSDRAVPSMAQSLAISKTFYEVTLWGIGAGVDRLVSPRHSILNAVAKGVARFPFVFFSFKLPAGTGWAHEEYHRAVMGRRGVDSYNEIYRLRLLSNIFYVSELSDEDLIAMKAEHPRDTVRMQSAGYEALHEVVLGYQKDAFFRGIEGQAMFYLLNTINNVAYVGGNAEANIDDTITELNASDGADIAKRDFTGPDFTGWVYDLFRPEEPYTGRGVHPSGVGINRYVKYASLTGAERSYISKQARRAWLSFLDPTMLGIDRIRLRWLGDGTSEALFNVKHHLTSFGSAINLNLFAKTPAANALVAVTMYENFDGSFPGIDAQVIDYPMKVAGRRLYVTPRLMMWMQPRDQQFMTQEGEAGGLASAIVAVPLSSNLRLVGEFEGKTKGWVASHAALESEVTGRLGLSLTVW
jgi:hypothetical protein